MLREAGSIISTGKITNNLIKDKKDEFTAEKKAIFESGMKQAGYFHIYDTNARYKGINHYAHVVCD